MLKVVLSLCAVVAAVAALTVWPQPQVQTWPAEATTYSMDPYSFNFNATGYQSEYLDDAFRRYVFLIFQHSATRRRSVGAPDITGCDVKVLTSNTSLTVDTDESYTLDVVAPRIQITANTVFGALHGIETFSQLVYRGEAINATTINDFPRFAIRAFMIDTARHWYPVDLILAHLDAMAYNKFNVLHWHIVDTTSFPFQSWTYPSLSETGAYTPDHIYTHEDVSRIIQYAYARGIRVIPEFDTPGHVQVGYASIPNLLTQCYNGDQPDGTGPLNPTLESTYTFLRNFYAEVKSVFIDDFVHVGGDEVGFDCWQSNPQIQEWMAAHPNISTYADLEAYYELNLLKILEEQGTSYICWQDVFNNGVPLLSNTVVDVWESANWQTTISQVTAAGYQAILSAPFYLNYISYGEDWPNYYSVEPTDFTGNAAQKALVAGVEACMWSEFVDGTNFLSRTWPRASAVGERAWSAEDVTNVTTAQTRLNEFHCKLIQRNIPAEPMTSGAQSNGMFSWCEVEYLPVYQPPWE